MLNVKADFDLRNCALCDSDRIEMSGYTESYGQGFQYCHAEIVCHSCGTRFSLQGKCKQDVIDLWNNGKIPQSVQ